MDNLRSTENVNERDKPSDSNKMVLVECDGVRHLAIQDHVGKWRTISRKKELVGLIEIVKML